MKLHVPTYMGGREVELDTDGISENEYVAGWIDEWGTITSSVANVIIGDIVQVMGGGLIAEAVLILKRDPNKL